MSESFDPAGRRRLALLAFVGHAPGLKLWGRCRFSPWLTLLNVIAAAATVLAMVLAGVLAPPGSGLRWVFVTWVVGHFGWSITLSTLIATTAAVHPRPVADAA